MSPFSTASETPITTVFTTPSSRNPTETMDARCHRHPTETLEARDNATAEPRANSIALIREFEKKLVASDRSCFGCLQLKSLLMALALLNFVFDAFFACLTLDAGDPNLLCLFALSSVGSLLCLCTVISAVQVEKHKTLSATVIWVSLKLMILVVLYVVATTYLLEAFFDETAEALYLTPTSVLLYATLPFCAFSLGCQWIVTNRVVALLQDRDEFYVIPSDSSRSADMRPSLRLYFAAQKLRKYEQFDKY